MWGYKPASACFLPLLPSVSSVQRGKKMDFFINPKIKKTVAFNKHCFKQNSALHPESWSVELQW